ncbi:MAG: polysaccharide deacetylase family protein [Bacteroidota bacterium]
MLGIINHHYIRNDFTAPYPSIFGITPQQFKRKLKEYIQFAKVVSENTVVEAIANDTELKGKHILISFDDGLKEQYKYALPVLNELDLPAIFYINTKPLMENKICGVHKIHIVRSLLSTEYILQELIHAFNKQIDKECLDMALVKGEEHYKYDKGKAAQLKYLLNFVLSSHNLEEYIDYLFESVCNLNENEMCESLYMNEKEIKELAQLGYIGSHSHEHIPLGLQTEEQINKNLNDSKMILENLTGEEISGFSFPYGGFDSCKGLTKDLVNSGYKYAVTMERSINKNLKYPFQLGRLDNNDTHLGKNYKYEELDFFNKYPAQSWQL